MTPYWVVWEKEKGTVKRMKIAAAFTVLLAIAAHGLHAATIRVGEQDTCKVTGVTTVENSKDMRQATIRFDLSKLQGAKGVKKGVLRLWLNLYHRDRMARYFAIERWNEEGFDGFKVWDAAVEGGDALDTVYPFAATLFACHEWDVTRAVAKWLKDPASNKGLKSNFPFPAKDHDPAWLRPYLQITYAGPNADRPKQPTELKAFYRSGQVFLTWKQIPHSGAFFDSTYRVYAHTAPITAANLDKARLLGEVNRLSQFNYRRTALVRAASVGSYVQYPYYGILFTNRDKGAKANWRNRDWVNEHAKVRVNGEVVSIPKRHNFVIDDTWREKLHEGKWQKDIRSVGTEPAILQGPELSDGTGLFVRTVTAPGKAYYAVTSVLEGNENRTDLTKENALGAAVDAKVATPRPVPQVAYVMPGRRTYRHRRMIQEFAYWGGGEDGLHVEPSTPFYFGTIPHNEFIFPTKRKAATASYSGVGTGPTSNVRIDNFYVPPTRLAPFGPVALGLFSWPGWTKFYQGAKDGTPTRSGVQHTHYRAVKANQFGYHDRFNTGKDPRKATMLDCFEKRIVREIGYYFDAYPETSRDHLFSVGEGTAVIVGIHYPDLFSFVSVGQFVPWSAKKLAYQWMLAGKQEWNLKLPNGEIVWNWNDPVWYSKKFPKKTWPFISSCQSPNYSKADNFMHWKDSGYPEFYLELAKEKRGGRWWWCDIGDAPGGKSPYIPGNEAYPAFTDVNFCEVPQQIWRKEPRGSLNGYLTWGPNPTFMRNEGARLRKQPDELGKLNKAGKTMATVDTPDRFEMTVRIGEHGLSLNGQSVPPTAARYGKTDITLWRLQQFKVEPGKTYRWANQKVYTGQILQTGTVKPDERNLLTIPGFFIDRDATGNKLIVTPESAPAPAVAKDKPVRLAFYKRKAAPEIVNLAYADYVKACANPVLAPSIKLPSTTLRIGDFSDVTRSDADGSATARGGSFGGGWSTALMIPEEGHYVIAVRAKGKPGYSWPVLKLTVGGRWTSKGNFPAHAIRTEEYATYRWYTRLEKGKERVQLAIPSEYYFQHSLKTEIMRKKRLTVADMTLTHIPDDKAATTTVELRLSPTHITVGPGMPVQMKAEVLNGAGKAIEADIAWSCEGGTVDGKGVFSSAKAGPCTITAKGKGLTASTTISVGDKLVDRFDEGSGYLRPSWKTITLKGPAVAWHPPARGHWLLNSLIANLPRGARTPPLSALVWEPGAAMTDGSIQADIIFFRRPPAAPSLHGLVIRALDKDNHYRLEVTRGPDASSIKLVRRLDGVESTLATAENPPKLGRFDWKTNPSQHVKNSWSDEQGQKYFATWRLDRIRLQAKGDTIQAWIGDKELFPGGIKDEGITAGAPGLLAGYAAVIDNVEIGGAK